MQHAVAARKYSVPTPVQEQAIPPILDGQDLLGSAQTGTGKTAAFVLPILQRLTLSKKNAVSGRPRVLILAPTRELAAQIGMSIAVYGRHLPLRHTVVFGGVKQHDQVKGLRRGSDLLVATPGRLIDLMGQGYCSLEAVEIFVLDEADRMLDMGFLPDIRKVIEKIPVQRQTLFFSATLQPEVMKLARSLVHDAVEVAIAPEAPVVELIDQSVCFVDPARKFKLLASLLADTQLTKVLVFTRLKHQADRLAERLVKAGIAADAIHSDKSQNARMRILENFKRNRVRVLVATDIAARGLDVDRISHVVNYDLPDEAETYVHRIGRTARAGKEGDAVSFCSAPECGCLYAIERLLGNKMPVRSDNPFHSEIARSAYAAASRKKEKRTFSPKFNRQRDKNRLKKSIAYSGGKETKRSGSPRKRK